jgi:hypothetical protein
VNNILQPIELEVEFPLKEIHKIQVYLICGETLELLNEFPYQTSWRKRIKIPEWQIPSNIINKILGVLSFEIHFLIYSRRTKFIFRVLGKGRRGQIWFYCDFCEYNKRTAHIHICDYKRRKARKQ